MARSTRNRQVTENDKGYHKSQSIGAPAQETANARVHMIGPFRKANLTTGMSAVAMTVGGVDSDAATSQLAHSAGEILGMAYQFNANITAGGASAVVVQPTVAPLGVDANVAVAGNSVAIPSGGSTPPKGVVDQTSPVAKFNKGDALGVQIVSTNGSLAPTTDDFNVWLLVRWAPSPLETANNL